MNFLLRQALKKGGKRAKDMVDIDAASPITIDGANFALEIGKGILKIGKELMF
jgi:hypothetical protein